jgi:hypothetical protein
VTEPESESVTVHKTKPRTVSRAKPTPKAQPAVVAKTTPKPKPKTTSELSVDCILDPASCGRGSTATPTKPKTSPPTASRPDKLSSTQIKNALAKPKSQSRTCGEIHAAPAGTKVTVRLSVDGSTGRVISAKPQAPNANALGSCVADKLSDATFPRFASPAMGILYSVRM